jgi:hypothetical protein
LWKFVSCPRIPFGDQAVGHSIGKKPVPGGVQMKINWSEVQHNALFGAEGRRQIEEMDAQLGTTLLQNAIDPGGRRWVVNLRIGREIHEEQLNVILAAKFGELVEGV